MLAILFAGFGVLYGVLQWELYGVCCGIWYQGLDGGCLGPCCYLGMLRLVLEGVRCVMEWVWNCFWLLDEKFKIKYVFIGKLRAQYSTTVQCQLWLVMGTFFKMRNSKVSKITCICARIPDNRFVNNNSMV